MVYSKMEMLKKINNSTLMLNATIIKHQLVVHLGLKARNDIKIPLSIGELSILGDFYIFVTALLLTLSYFNPLLSSKMLAKLREDILGTAKAVKYRAILDRIKKHMVIWPYFSVSLVILSGHGLYLTARNTRPPDGQRELGPQVGCEHDECWT